MKRVNIIVLTLILLAVVLAISFNFLGITGRITGGAILSSQKVVSFTLIDADTGKPVPGYETLEDGDTINLALLSNTNFNIVANVIPADSGSVKFVLDGTTFDHTKVENNPPYALFGNTGEDYNGWTAPVGTYTLTATPYTRDKAGGTAGTPLRITFTVIDIPELELVSLGTGTGLNATYYNNLDFTGTSVKRVDSKIDFSWGTGSPVSGIASDTFSVRWIGFIEPLYTEEYTIYIRSDDGMRAYVDNTLVVSDYVVHSSREKGGKIRLEAGRRYPIKVEYFENKVSASARLSWSSASQAKEVVPKTQLYTSVPSTPTPTPKPQCSDGIDNDGDGLIDYPADPGCTSNYGRTDCSSSNNYCNGADIDKDGDVDLSDLGVLAGDYGRTDCSSSNNYCNGSDIDADGDVDLVDLGIISGQSDNDEYNAPVQTAPPAPSGLSATASSTSSIALTWNDVTGETGYKLERALASGGPWNEIISLAENVVSYSNTGLADGTTYYYRVKAFNGAGDSPLSNVASATTPSIPTPTPPPTPTGFSATAVSSSQIDLRWNDVSGETSYVIERSTSLTGTYTQIATPIADSTSYSNTGLTASTSYYYRIKAVNSDGSSGYASTNAKTRDPSPTPTPTGDYYVSTTGSDSNPGTSSQPFKTISKGISVAGAGDTVIIKAGTYKETLNFPSGKSGTASNPITIMGESYGNVIVDGDYNLGRLLLSTGADYVTIKNIVFREGKPGTLGYDDAVVALKASGTDKSTGWLIEDVTIEDNAGPGLGVSDTQDVVINRVLAQRNVQAGIGGPRNTNLLMKNSISRDNNYGWNYDPAPNDRTAKGEPKTYLWNGKWYVRVGHDAGGGKFSGTRSATIDNHAAYNNHGPGVWFDYNNKNVVVKNSVFHDNVPAEEGWGGVGLFIEFNSEGPIDIMGNRFYGNDNSGLTIAESRNVDVTNGNRFEGNGNGIKFRNLAARSGSSVQNILIEGNIFTGGATISTGAGNIPTNWQSAWNVVIRNNQGYP